MMVKGEKNTLNEKETSGSWVLRENLIEKRRGGGQGMPLWKKILEHQDKMAELRKVHFLQDVLWSYQWWILVAATIVLWALWVILLDRTRLRNILIVGLLAMGFALVLDDIGLSMALWNYPYKIVFFSTRLSPVDMVILPVTFMLIYQYFRGWVTYILFCILFSAFASFIAEPLFVKLNMYDLLQWKFMYSAPIYVGIGIIIKGAVDLTERLERKARSKKKS